MIEKPASRLIQTLEAQSFTVIGCPCADGLGVEPMQTYADAIVDAEGDFIVTLGDVSPLGRDPHYRNVARFLDQVCEKPMYVMPGAGDGPAFGDYFGHRNKAVISEEFFLVMLDNSERRFSDEALSFLRQTLAMADSPNIVVAFHYPPPNRFTGDSLSQAEWSRFEEAAGVWRKRITLLVAGRAHSYFEDEVDGLHLLVTGGGGAVMHDLERVPPFPHHRVEFRFEAGDGMVVGPEAVVARRNGRRDDRVREGLEAAFRDECRAHACHLLDAEAAEKRGLVNLARLFRAAAESHFRQARNLRLVMTGSDDPVAAIGDYLADAPNPGQGMRLDRIALADDSNDSLASRAFQDMAASQIVNQDLLESARAELAADDDIAAVDYRVCSSCGVVFSGGEAPDNCPECGAPAHMIREVL